MVGLTTQTYKNKLYNELSIIGAEPARNYEWISEIKKELAHIQNEEAY